MRTFVDPPLSAWQPADPGARAADCKALVARVDVHARRLGTGVLPDARPIIATGHQAWLWHPGILAKDLAMVAACERFDAAPLHLVVDQDTHDALSLELPVERGERIDARRLRLASHRIDVPTGAQPPVDADEVRDALRRLDDERLASVVEAFDALPACRTLAEQMAVVLVRLMRPWTDGPLPVLFTSDLPHLPGYVALLDRMLADARHCVAAYNAAVRALPEAGLSELVELREWVELPVWAVRWEGRRERVFADFADREPMLVDRHGEPIDREKVSLLPRAMLLTAVMRSLGCDLFIHGKGGAIYDRATQRWWQTWAGDALAPMVTVSADLHLAFRNAPTSDPAIVARAVWYRHHAPHNIDRIASIDGPLVQRKRELLAHMNDDRDRKRRRAAFERLHAINAQLAAEHPHAIAEADRQLERARLGLHNAGQARRRDWCFALYPRDRLTALRDALTAHTAPRL